MPVHDLNFADEQSLRTMIRQVGLIFDLDGTLIDSLDDITSSLNSSLAAIGKHPAMRHDVRAWIGDGIVELCRRALGDEASSEALESLVKKMRETYARQSVVKTAPYPNILKMLELISVAGYPMSVLSNKPHALVTLIMEQLQLAPLFLNSRGYINEEDKKPSPKMALEFARQMHLDPAQVFIVGDSEIDIATARNAGMKVVAVTWGYREKKYLADASPDHLIDDPLALLSILKNF